MLLSVGEQITISKVCMCLKELDYDAVSLLGWQVPIITNNIYGNARIECIGNKRIQQELKNNNIVVIAGFQGVTEDGEITTLGRGGSDTTAVAIAAAIKATRCDIYTDVNGIYSADPKIVKDVKKIDSISYDEMLELSSLGAKVLHNRCVEIGKKYNLPICVKSTFEKDSIGTILKENDVILKSRIAGIAKDDNISKITLIRKENSNIKIDNVFKLLSENDISVDTIVHNFDDQIIKDISFTVSKDNLNKVLEVLNSNLEKLYLQKILTNEKLSKISIVGIGMVSNPEICSNIFEILYENNINIYTISTSETKISILVNKDISENILNRIHEKLINI